MWLQSFVASIFLLLFHVTLKVPAHLHRRFDQTKYCVHMRSTRTNCSILQKKYALLHSKQFEGFSLKFKMLKLSLEQVWSIPVQVVVEATTHVPWAVKIPEKTILHFFWIRVCFLSRALTLIYMEWTNLILQGYELFCCLGLHWLLVDIPICQAKGVAKDWALLLTFTYS